MSQARTISLSIAAGLVGLGGVVCWQLATPDPSTVAATAATPPKAFGKDNKSAVLTPQVAQLLTSDSTSLADRLATLATVGNRLPDTDRAALLASITNTPPIGLNSGEWHALANDILQVLRNQQPYTPQYTDRLIALWHDKTLDPTLRDYALQQLREWIADSDTRTVHEERPEKIALIQQTFLDAATPGHPTCDPQSTTTGTALLALDEWAYSSPLKSPIPDLPSTSSSPPNFQSQISNLPSHSSPKSQIPNLQSLLLAHAADASTHRGVRATALQLCANRGITDALPIARAIIAAPATPAILHMSAISLLGTLGNADDLKLLTTFQKKESQDPLLHTSLHKAITHLSQRTN
jgi:hypothetical protein